MFRIIEHRDDVVPGESAAKLRVWKLNDDDVRACALPIDASLDPNGMHSISDPVAEAFLDAIAACVNDGISALWIHDPLGLFPPHDRPVRNTP